MAAFTVFRLIDIGELDHEDGRSDIGGALERDDYLVRAKPSELRPQRALVRRQLRQTGERHVPSRWLRRRTSHTGITISVVMGTDIGIIDTGGDWAKCSD